MATTKGRRVSLLGRIFVTVLSAGALGASLAFASGPGSDHEPDDDPVEDVSDNSGSGSDIDEPEDVDEDASDNSGPDDDSSSSDSSSDAADDADSGADDSDSSGGSGSGGDDDDGDSSGDDDSGSGGSSGSGSGDDDDDDGDDGDDNSGSGGHSGSGSGGGDDDEGGRHSGSSANSNSSDGGEERGFADHGDRLEIETDERGDEHVAGEALLTGAQHDVDAAAAAGFIPISQTRLASLDSVIARLALPAGMSIDHAMLRLQVLAPLALVSPNHAYHNAQANITQAPARRRAPAPHFVGAMGIIDTGVAAEDLAQPSALLSQRAFAGAAPAPREHGGAVAALAISQGIRVHVADVFGASTAGQQVASAESIAGALDWMMENQVPVINISIEGPNNPILRALVRRASERGHVIVAAAGNGGPLAQPAYPAAFEGSLAITAIDANNRVYARANRGGYIDFAEHGVNLNVPTGGDDLVVSGTSFASPLVAARIAAQLQTPSVERARVILADLRAHALDLGDPGHDPIFGWGAVRN
jgi:minor extracellular protease Epr